MPAAHTVASASDGGGRFNEAPLLQSSKISAYYSN